MSGSWNFTDGKTTPDIVGPRKNQKKNGTLSQFLQTAQSMLSAKDSFRRFADWFWKHEVAPHKWLAGHICSKMCGSSHAPWPVLISDIGSSLFVSNVTWCEDTISTNRPRWPPANAARDDVCAQKVAMYANKSAGQFVVHHFIAFEGVAAMFDRQLSDCHADRGFWAVTIDRDRVGRYLTIIEYPKICRTS